MKNSGMGIVFVFLLLMCVKVFDISYPVKITQVSSSGELSVVGEGKVDVVPDVAYAEVGITVADAKTVAEAQTKINETNNAIIESLKKLGIEKKDIKTSNYSINPNYSYEQSGAGKIVGYNGNVNISIKIVKTEFLADVLQEATNAGANQVYSTRYEIGSPEKYREEAREKAIKNAKDQATKIAKSLGISLGKVVNVVESSPNTGFAPVMYDKAIGLGGGGAAPVIEPGSQTVSSIVTLYFEKK